MKTYDLHLRVKPVADEKVSLSNPTLRTGVILRDTFPPKEVQLAAFMAELNARGVDFVRRPQKQSPWQNKTISALYKKHFLRHFPGRFTIDHYHLFLGLTVPSLARILSFEAMRCLCGTVHWRNRKLLLSARISREKHRRRCMAIIYNTFIPNPPHHDKITKPIHREAWRILWAMAIHKGEGDSIEGHFFIASRELRDRLFVRSYKTAQRVLERFCKLGVIRKVASGQTRWDANRDGEMAKANCYQVVIERNGV